MEQSVIIKDETLAKIIAKAEQIISRELEGFEKTLMEYAVEQIRLGLVK